MIDQKWFAFLFDNRVRYMRLTTKKYEKLKIVGNSISVNIIMALTTVLLSPQNEALSCLQNHSFVNRLSSMRQLKRCALRPKRSIFNCLTDISLLTMLQFFRLDIHCAWNAVRTQPANRRWISDSVWTELHIASPECWSKKLVMNCFCSRVVHLIKSYWLYRWNLIAGWISHFT